MEAQHGLYLFLCDGTRRSAQQLQKLPVMQDPESDGQHGFILHDVCWRLLLKAGEPLGVPILRLVLMCESLPFPLGFDGVYWGHT
jgi:hypothetical protein